MFRKLYDWMLAKAASPQAVPALATVSFVESSVFPLPPDIMLLPMCLADRKRAFFFAFVATVASVLGGMFGYAIGYFLFEGIGKPVLDLYGGSDGWLEKFNALFAEHGFWLVLMAGITPFPFKVITILSGVAHFNFVAFVLGAVLARGIRFFAVSTLLYFFGEKMRQILEAHFDKITVLFFVLLVGGFVLVKFLL